ncbi:ankyrin repeat-containing domain protein [Mycena haematopus]|nr:ankyrin repeat-containing domain protein [Mycena haematopus]
MLAQLPPELILHIVSFLTRKALVGPWSFGVYVAPQPALVPDLLSINALSRTNTVLHHTLDQILYELCASTPIKGKLALLFAATHQLEGTFDKLVAAGIDVVFATSLLQVVAGEGHRDMVVKLLGMCGEEMAARVHARDDANLTALDYAAGCGHLDIVQLLAPISLPSSDVSINSSGETRERYMSITLLKMALDSGADSGVIMMDIAQLIAPHPISLSGASITSPTIETRERYLSIALRESAKYRHFEISQHLISKGADVNFLDNRFHFSTPLFYAVGSQSLELVQLLLASGADPNRSGNTGIVPLFHAATFRSVDIAQALLAAGANLDAQDNRSRNVLFCDIEDIEMFRFLLECGADPNYRDRFGHTPLHHISYRPTELRKPFVELLLQFGAVMTKETDDENPN